MNSPIKKRSFTLSDWGGQLLLLAFLGLLVALVLLQANPLVNYPSRDGGNYAYVGKIILEGKIPYIDVWDHKPPAIYYLNALALWLGGGTRWGIWLLEFVFLFAATGIGYWLMNRLWNPSAAVFGTMIWLVGLNLVLSKGNFTEEYSLFLNFLALYVFWVDLQKEKAIHNFIIGLALAISFLFRPNNIGVEISIVLVWTILYLSKRKIGLLVRKLLWLVLGAGLVFVAVGVYFWVIGAFHQMIEEALLYNLSYTGGHTDLLSSLISGFSNLKLVAWVGVSGFVLAIWLLVQRLKDRSWDGMVLLLIIGWPMEIVMSALSGRNFGHYFISWLPIIALSSGCFFFWLVPQLFAPKLVEFIQTRTKVWLSTLLLLGLIVFRHDVVTYGKSFYRILFHPELGVEKIQSVAQYVRENTTPDQEILVWGGQAGIYVMAQRDAATAYYMYPKYVDSPFLSELDAGFYDDVTTRLPVLIVDAYIHTPDDVLSINPETREEQIAAGKGQLYQPPHLDQFYFFVQTNYVLETVVDGYEVYRLNRH